MDLRAPCQEMGEDRFQNSPAQAAENVIVARLEAEA